VSFPPHPSAPEPRRFASFDGRTIAYHDVGEGRPTLLVHGIMSSAAWAWFGPGHVAKLTSHGRRAIVQELRGHASSDAPHDPAAYAGDALAHDLEILLAHLRVDEVDLVGYSLGARTAIRFLVRGARPGRVVLGGTGDALVTSDGSAMADRFDRLIATDGQTNDPSEAQTWSWLTYGGFDPLAMRALARGLIATSPAELAAIDVPALVVIGDADTGVGSAERLAALLGNAYVRTIPGDHVQAGLSAAFLDATVAFLDAQPHALTAAVRQRSVSQSDTSPREARRPAPGGAARSPDPR
jgi:pimeloyl-ACP methyl ester carboxylesterase